MANLIQITLSEDFDTFRRKFNTLSEFVGDSDLLTTDSDDSLVFAINSLDSNLGTRLSLTTIDKTDIVSAINELDSDIGASPNDNLTTVAKNLTLAINEHDLEIGTITAVAMGTSASTVSTAIAELDGRLDSINTTELLSPRMTLSDSSATSIIRGGLQVDTSVTINNDLNVLDSARVSGKLSVSNTSLFGANATFNTDVSVDGKLTTTGEVDMSGSSIISLGDNNIVFNADHTGVPTEDVGITVERGDRPDAVFEWSEGNRYWIASIDHANAGDAPNNILNGRVVTTEDSATIANAMIAEGTIANSKLVNNTISFIDSAGTTSQIALGSDVTFKGGEGVDVVNSSGTFTISGEDASYTNKGVAKFLETDFTVSSGYVSIKDENIQDIAGAMFSGNTETNISATYQDDDGTIDLSVNTATSSTLGVAKFTTDNFSVSNGTVSIKTGGVANVELANSSIGFSDGSTVTEKSLGTDMVFTDVSKETSVRESDGNLSIGLADDVIIQGQLTVLGRTVLNQDLELVGETKFTGQYIRLADSNSGAGLENYEDERAGLLFDLGTNVNKYFVYDDSIGQFHWHDSGSQIRNVLLTTQNVQGTSGEINVTTTSSGATLSLPATTTIDTLSTDNIQNTSGNITFTSAADGDFNFKQNGVSNPALKIDTVGYFSDTNAPIMTTDGTNDFYVKSNALSIINHDSTNVGLSLQPYLSGNISRIWSSRDLHVGTDQIAVTVKGSAVNLDATGDINLDAAGNDIWLKDNGTRFGRFTHSGAGVKMYGDTNNGYIHIEDSDIILNGRVTFQGGVTEINATQLDIGDNIIVLNNDVSGSPTQNAGIEVERGTKANAKLQWNETGNYWEATNSDGSIGLGRIITTLDSATIPNTALQGGITINSTEVPVGGSITLDTGDLAEADGNLYFTNARARAAISAGEGIDITDGEIKGENATLTNKGIASFNTADFSVSAGAVSIKSSGVSNTQLAGSIGNAKLSNSSITIAGTSVALGGSISASTILGAGSFGDLDEVKIAGPSASQYSLTIGTTATSYNSQPYGSKDGIFIGDDIGDWAGSSTTSGARAYDESVVIGTGAYGGGVTAPSESAEATDKKEGVSIGYSSLSDLDSGGQNVALGAHAGELVTSGKGNTIIGTRAASLGHGTAAGVDNSVIIGQYAGNHMLSATGGIKQNNIIIGNNASGSTANISNEITLGDANITQFRIPGLLTTINGNQNAPGGLAVFKTGISGTNELEFSNHFKVDTNGNVEFEVGSNDDFIVNLAGDGKVHFDGSSVVDILLDDIAEAVIKSSVALDVEAVGDMRFIAGGDTFKFVDNRLTPTSGLEIELDGQANLVDISTDQDTDDLLLRAGGDLELGSKDNNIIPQRFANSLFNPSAKFDTNTADQFSLHTYDTTTTSYTLNTTWYDDNMFVSGDIISASDERLKENIETIDNPLDIIDNLRGVYYNLIDKEDRKVGVIAQETEKALPEVVHTDDDGMKAVDYGKMVGVLIEAIKDLNQEVKELKAKIGQ
jgi:hypothetical protein